MTADLGDDGDVDLAALSDEVEAIIRATADEVIRPRFLSLTAEEIFEKRPGDLVTVADREAEQRLAERLVPLLTDSIMIGEEGVSADPRVIDGLQADRPVWVVDPLDGTTNFTKGSPDFAVIVALVQRRRTVAAWIWQPIHAQMLRIGRGQGVHLNGEPLTAFAAEPSPHSASRSLSGIAKLWYVPKARRAAMAAGISSVGQIGSGVACCGIEYTHVARRIYDFAFYWTVSPWDHLAGALAVTELGGKAAFVDGRDYGPDQTGHGLLVARSEQSWAHIAALLHAT